MPDQDMDTYETIQNFIFDGQSSHNQRILNRNGKDWDEFVLTFTIDELFQIREYLYCHPIFSKYDFNDSDDVSDLIYDYIKWWIFDLIQNDEISYAKTVINAGFI